jgi:hypothetical protein
MHLHGDYNKKQKRTQALPFDVGNRDLLGVGKGGQILCYSEAFCSTMTSFYRE